MGYDIYIGEASIEPSPDEIPEWVARGWLDSLMPRVIVHELAQDDAPCFDNDDLTEKKNYRAPSYTVWGNCMEEAGLDDLFFDKSHGLMHEHPGAHVLLPAHGARITQALTTYRARYPYAVPRFGCHVRDEDAVLARLIWLEWWVRWALENCRVPTIYNC